MGKRYPAPKIVTKQDGNLRRVGFELEFSGVALEDAARVLQAQLGVEGRKDSAASWSLDVASHGTFQVELDWDFLKRMADERGEGQDDAAWLETLGKASALLVPVEVVCPPLALDRLEMLDPLVTGLREAGAVGTEESLIAAYGVHVNTEIPQLDAPTIAAYVEAFLLLQWWLVDSWGVDVARRLSPYINLFPETYMERVFSRENVTLDQLFADYLEHNATRNRALDLLPMLAELDEARVRRVIDDPKIKARPAFHYRLPDCHIEREGWSLDEAWRSWLLVERLASLPEEREVLVQAFRDASRPVLGVNRKEWVARMSRWIEDHASA